MRFTHISMPQAHLAFFVLVLISFAARSSSAQTDAATAPNPTPNSPAATAPPPTAEAPPPTASAVGSPTSTSSTSPASGAPTNPTPSACSLEALTALHRDARRFLVEVHARQGSTATTGVVIAPDRVVVPYSGVLSERWPIAVYFHDGTQTEARVLRILDSENLAVLELEKPPTGLAPRLFSKTIPQLGTPVISVGNALHDGKNVTWEMRSAAISSTNGKLLAASPAPTAGAPLLNCAGELIGVQMRQVLDESPIPSIVSAPSLSTTLATPSKITPSGYFGIGFFDPSVVLAMRPSDTGIGFKFTFADIGFKPRFFMRMTFGAQWLTVPERSDYPDATSVFRWRLQVESVIGFNQRFTFGSPAEGFLHIDVSPFIGAAVRTDYTDLQRLGSDSVISSQTLREEHINPLIGVSVGLSKVIFSYQFQLDLKSPKHSLHTVGLGKRF